MKIVTNLELQMKNYLHMHQIYERINRVAICETQQKGPLKKITNYYYYHVLFCLEKVVNSKQLKFSHSWVYPNQSKNLNPVSPIVDPKSYISPNLAIWASRNIQVTIYIIHKVGS